MSNLGAITGAITMVVVVFSITIELFHFWVFPTLIDVLRGIDFVNVTESFVHSLYWLVQGLFFLFGARSTSATFKG